MTSSACLRRVTDDAMASAPMEKDFLCAGKKEQVYFMDAWRDTHVKAEHGCLSLTDAVVDGGDGKDGRHNRNAPDGHDDFVSDAARHNAALRMARQFDRITG